jgi:hypothetical protein
MVYGLHREKVAHPATITPQSFSASRKNNRGKTLPAILPGRICFIRWGKGLTLIC